MSVSPPDRHPDLRVEIRSQPRLLSSVRSLLACFAGRMGFDEGQCGQISLAVDEALSNIINHGYDRRDDGPIWISIWFDDDPEPPELHVMIEDEARQVDPDSIKSRCLDDVRPGGLGVHIIRHVMDHVDYCCRDDCGMRVTMTKRLGDDSPTDDDCSTSSSTPVSESET